MTPRRAIELHNEAVGYGPAAATKWLTRHRPAFTTHLVHAIAYMPRRMADSPDKLALISGLPLPIAHAVWESAGARGANGAAA